MIFGSDPRLGCCFRRDRRNSLAWVDYSLEIAAVTESFVIAKTRSPEHDARALPRRRDSQRQLDPASLRRSASNAALDLWRAFLA